MAIIYLVVEKEYNGFGESTRRVHIRAACVSLLKADEIRENMMSKIPGDDYFTSMSIYSMEVDEEPEEVVKERQRVEGKPRDPLFVFCDKQINLVGG